MSPTVRSRRDGFQIRLRWRHIDGAEPFRARYTRWSRAAGDDVLLFTRLGRFVEFYGAQRLLAQREFGLAAARLPRFGYALLAGFPIHLANRYALQAVRRGLAVAYFVWRREWIEGRGTLFVAA